MSNEDKQRVKFLDIILYSDIRGKVTSAELKNLPVYKWIGEGVIQENYGVITNREDILFYDVTSASPEFHEQFGSVIQELEVTKIIPGRKPKKQSVETQGNIVNVLPVTGVYTSLNKKDRSRLGKDFVSLTHTDGGIEIKPVLIARIAPDNLYLRVDTTNLDDELFETISSELEELLEKENGLYESKGGFVTGKEL